MLRFAVYCIRRRESRALLQRRVYVCFFSVMDDFFVAVWLFGQLRFDVMIGTHKHKHEPKATLLLLFPCLYGASSPSLLLLHFSSPLVTFCRGYCCCFAACPLCRMPDIPFRWFAWMSSVVLKTQETTTLSRKPTPHTHIVYVSDGVDLSGRFFRCCCCWTLTALSL